VKLPIASAAPSIVELPSCDAAVDRTPLTVRAMSRWLIEEEPGMDAVKVSLESTTRSLLPTRAGHEVEVEESVTASVEAEFPGRATLRGTTDIHQRLSDGRAVLVQAALVATQDETVCTGRVMIEGQVVFEKCWW
jgi:hypothetical protein